MWSDGRPSVAAGDSDGAVVPYGAGHLQENSCSLAAGNSGNSGSSENGGPADSPQAQCHINFLPREILWYIFSFLSMQELGRSVEPVCVLWRDLARDPTLRRRLVFHKFIDLDRFKKLLASAPLLLTLELQNRYNGQDMLLLVADFCPRLRELTVNFCDGLTELVLRTLVENCSRLQSFTVACLRMHKHEIQCFNLIADFVHLRHLSLSQYDLLDDLALVTIARQCRSLEHLNIEGRIGIHDSSIVFLTESLCSSLKCLLLEGENLTDVSYMSLRACTNLQKLGLSNCDKMTDISLLGIQDLKQLTYLKLCRGFQLTAKGIRSLFENGSLSQLTYVNLGWCYQLDDSVLEAIGACCPLLLYLAIHWCREISDDGMSAFISRCPGLQVLELEGVHKLTGAIFSDVLTVLPDLHVLDLEECRDVGLDKLLLEMLVRQKPSIHVLDYWGDIVVPPELVNHRDESRARNAFT